MSTREELAETIAVALRGEDQFGYTDISDLSDAVLDSRYDLLAVADAVLAEYRPGELREPLGEQLQRLLRVAKGSRLVVREIGRGVDASRPLVPRR